MKLFIFFNRIFLFISILLLPITVYSDDLQRLFTLPEQRQIIDELRTSPPAASIEIEGGTITESAEHVTLNGIVLSSSGAVTVWANEQYGEYYADFQIDTQHASLDSIPIILSSGETCWLKPGQSLNTNNGVITDKLAEQQNCFNNLPKR